MLDLDLDLSLLSVVFDATSSPSVLPTTKAGAQIGLFFFMFLVDDAEIDDFAPFSGDTDVVAVLVLSADDEGGVIGDEKGEVF